MGGAGKTTLLQHLDTWWRTTGFIEQTFYFGYDDRAWTRQQILVEIAQKLFGLGKYYNDFQPLSLDAQQAMLTQRLRSERHLLILDNLESITGTHLAIQHTLPKEEQDALQRLLSDLSGGQTLVLLGSRGGEGWLAKGTFEDNVYELPGLDPEAASTLADRILERYRVTKYRKDPNLQKLLELLDGFPLALEVVLANLAHQEPGEILKALQAGDIKIDPKSDSQKRTESILLCIDYSHSNLSPDAQQLLLCLAPFTSVIYLDLMEAYTDQLRQQPILAALPFERWHEVLQEAANWGLLSPDTDIPSYLHLQPILPYFLRNRLGKPEQAEIKQAVETAFRQHYGQVGDAYYQLLVSKDPKERQIGQLLVSLEYENLMTALNLALVAQISIRNYYNALSEYLDVTQNQRRGLELGQTVLSLLENYPAEKLSGQLGAEFVEVIDDIAMRQLALKDYVAAEKSYQKALALVLQVEQIDKQLRDKMRAGIYHNLGIVAQEQRQWAQAEQYYQQALQIYVEYNDRYSQASTYGQLGIMAQEQGQWPQAREYFLRALEIFAEYKDDYNIAITLRNLARLWQASDDKSLSAAIAAILNAKVDEIEEQLRQLNGDGDDKQGK